MARTDVEGLSRLINLPYPPEELKWTTSTLPGRDDWSLRAIVRLRPEDVQELLRRSGVDPSSDALMSAEQLNWLPEAVRNEYRGPHADPDAISVQAVQLGPELFAAPEKSPLIHGRALVFVSHNLVYVGLFTM